MFIVDKFSPRVMLKYSTISCFIASLLIAVKGDESATFLFGGAFIFGFAVSWQFGAAFSWAAEHVDVAVSTDVCKCY